MISKEPEISVGIMEGLPGVRGRFNGTFQDSGGRPLQGPFIAAATEGGGIRIGDPAGTWSLVAGPDLVCTPAGGSDFLLHEVVIGIQFHWQRTEDQRFRGVLHLVRRPDGTLTVINRLPLEQYLLSVISSEMSGNSPIELLRAHAITSRSWLVAMLERGGHESTQGVELADQIIRWYAREDHDIYDVCADDHCQRYQGITKILSERATEAVASTRGTFLVYGGEVCDARYYKACGGLTEEYSSAWEDRDVPYLTSVSDGPSSFPPIRTEEEARRWVEASPDAYCNTNDPTVLRQILPSFDQETTDFFRWEVRYDRRELEQILRERSGIDFGTLRRIVPLQRGPSGRIVKLRIEGSKRSVIVGKELEVRRWLSRSHLYSSAFVVYPEGDEHGIPERFSLRGAGWGHGVGLCQIGAAVMATRGFLAEQIVRHYFPGSTIEKLY